MGVGKYILDDDGNPVPEPDLLKWVTWMETGIRRVNMTLTTRGRVSTVFLGLDHRFRFLDDGPPLLFETMIFGEDGHSEWDESYCEMYSTREEAQLGHWVAVNMLLEKGAQIVSTEPLVEEAGHEEMG
jgi:hypothetical protein